MIKLILVFFVIFTFFIPIFPLIVIYLFHSKKQVNSYETIPLYKTEIDIQKEVEKYIKTHAFTNYLENDFVVAKIDYFEDFDALTKKHFYVKVYSKKTKECFDIVGEERIISSLWATFQTYFTDLITYDGLKLWIKYHQDNIEIQYH